MMGPHDFLRTLWTDTPPGLVQIWELDTKRSSYYRAAHATRILAGHTDVYTAVATTHKDHGRSKRATAKQALAIAGLWLDLDVNGGPANKQGAIPTITDALAVAGLITEPTLVVGSGYGAHAWYLFDQPWRFTSVADQDAGALASAQWYALHRAAIAVHGWGLDSTHDLARLLRLPGTLNGKGETPVPVEVLHDSGPRYPREQLLDLAAQAGDVNVGGQAQMTLPDGQPLQIATTTGVPDTTRIKVEALIANVPEFAATWRHELGTQAAAWSLSEYDLSLAGQAAQAGFTDQELADLIRLHRAQHGNPKGERLDYLQRTIAKVRAPSTRDAAADTLEQLRRAA